MFDGKEYTMGDDGKNAVRELEKTVQVEKSLARRHLMTLTPPHEKRLVLVKHLLGMVSSTPLIPAKKIHLSPPHLMPSV